ncbi:MAG: polyhydroxyalkanoic acid system family protein [Candidatus Spechtbacterales bacterium]
MPKLNMTVTHKLSQDEALARIKSLLGEVKTEFGDKVSNLKEDWSGNRGTFSFSAMGFRVSGTLTVHESKVDLAGNLPFAAIPIKGKVEATIRERAEKLLA